VLWSAGGGVSDDGGVVSGVVVAGGGVCSGGVSAGGIDWLAGGC